MKTLLIASLLLCIASCRPKGIGQRPLADFYFTEAQPINDSELKEFPNRYQGKFQAADSNFILIDKNYIISHRYLKFRLGKSALDTIRNDYTYESGKLMSKVGNERYDVAKVGDSLELSTIEADTLFAFSEFQKAKKINGALVLSTKDSVYWKTEWLKVQKGELIVNQPFSNNDISRIDSVLSVKSEVLSPERYLMKPTRREFGKIMSLKHFGSERKYKKLKQNK